MQKRTLAEHLYWSGAPSELATSPQDPNDEFGLGEQAAMPPHAIRPVRVPQAARYTAGGWRKRIHRLHIEQMLYSSATMFGDGDAGPNSRPITLDLRNSFGRMSLPKLGELTHK